MTARPSTPWAAIVVIGLILLAGAVYLVRSFPEHQAGSPPAGDTATSSRSASHIQHASQSDFDQVVLGASKPVLVDFYADWCGPCRALAPVLEELARETPSAKIVKVNVDHNPGLATRYGIQGIPSLILFRNGQIANQVVGLVSKQQLQGMLTQ